MRKVHRRKHAHFLPYEPMCFLCRGDRPEAANAVRLLLPKLSDALQKDGNAAAVSRASGVPDKCASFGAGAVPDNLFSETAPGYIARSWGHCTSKRKTPFETVLPVSAEGQHIQSGERAPVCAQTYSDKSHGHCDPD